MKQPLPTIQRFSSLLVRVVYGSDALFRDDEPIPPTDPAPPTTREAERLFEDEEAAM